METSSLGRELTPVLLGLTAATGVIDAISYLGMGRVLVANMTGNVVFLGFPSPEPADPAAPHGRLSSWRWGPSWRARQSVVGSDVQSEAVGGGGS